MCFPCATGATANWGQPPATALVRKRQAAESPGATGAKRGRDAGANPRPRPGAAQKLIKSFVESY